jgi:hypothetical protein
MAKLAQYHNLVLSLSHRLLFFRPQGSLLDPFPSLLHCSSKCATPHLFFFFFPLKHTVRGRPQPHLPGFDEI